MTAAVSQPSISILMPSYNHARFIRAAVESILAQSFPDFELLIVDDGSVDASKDIISSFQDNRIRYRLLDQNVGAPEAMNIALEMSGGRYVAVCNSDDEWHPEKLAKQYQYLENNPAISAVYSDVVWIGDDGAPLNESRLPYFKSVFKQMNRSRGSWLRDFVEGGNCLCHPSALIKREIYDIIGIYDNRLRQLPDLDMWIRLVQHANIFVMRDALVGFRIHDSNTSAPHPATSRRSINEHRLIVRKTFGGIAKDNFIEAFGLKMISIDNDLDFAAEKALYLLSYRGPYDGIFRELALDLLYDAIETPEGRERLARKYAFDVAVFHKEMSLQSPWIVQREEAPSDILLTPVGMVRTVELAKIFVGRIMTKARSLIWREKFSHSARTVQREAPFDIRLTPVGMVRTTELSKILVGRIMTKARKLTWRMTS